MMAKHRFLLIFLILLYLLLFFCLKKKNFPLSLIYLFNYQYRLMRYFILWVVINYDHDLFDPQILPDLISRRRFKLTPVTFISDITRHSLYTSSLSGRAGCSRHTCKFPTPGSEPAISPRSPGSLHVNNHEVCSWLLVLKALSMD